MAQQKPLLATVKKRTIAGHFIFHISGHFGGRATPRSAEEMLDGQHQRVDITAPAGTVHVGLTQKRLEEDLC